MVDLLEQMAEARIREARTQGEFDNLVGTGKPLQLDQEYQPDPSLRVAYRILKNAGFVPKEVAQRQQIGCIESLLQQVTDPVKRRPLMAELIRQLSSLDCCINARADSRAHYFRQILDRLDCNPGTQTDKGAD